MSPEKMLEQFVADLTCGAGSGGSDERDLAERWYYRSFEMMGEDTFVSYLCSDEDMIEEWTLKDVLRSRSSTSLK